MSLKRDEFEKIECHQTDGKNYPAPSCLDVLIVGALITLSSSNLNMNFDLYNRRYTIRTTDKFMPTPDSTEGLFSLIVMTKSTLTFFTAILRLQQTSFIRKQSENYLKYTNIVFYKVALKDPVIYRC